MYIPEVCRVDNDSLSCSVLLKTINSWWHGDGQTLPSPGDCECVNKRAHRTLMKKSLSDWIMAIIY